MTSPNGPTTAGEGSRGRVALGIRAGVITGGAGLIAIGAALALGMLTLPQLVGLAVWLAAAVVLHDGVWVPLVTTAARAGSFARRRATRGR